MRTRAFQLERKPWGVLVLAAAIAALFNHYQYCSASTFSIHVEGTLTEIREPIGPMVGETAAYSFTVDVEGCRWLLKVTPLNPDYSTKAINIGGKQGFITTPDQITASSDSQHFYFYASAKRHIGKMMERGDMGKDFRSPSFSALRGPGSVPYGIDNKLLALWYAFASHCYFENEAMPGLLPPMQIMIPAFYQTNSFLVSAEWHLLGEPPGLPSFLISSNSDNRLRGPIVSLFRSGAPNTNVVFQVDATLKLGEYLIPSKANLVYFYYAVSNSSVINPVAASLGITVDKAGLGCGVGQFRPDIEGPALFSDLTFLSNKVSVGFRIINDWPSDAVVARVAARNAALSKVHASRPGTWMFIGLTLLSLPVFAVLSRQLTNKQKH